MTCWRACSTIACAPRSPPRGGGRGRACTRFPQESRACGLAHDGQFLFALVAPQTGCEVLEIGGSRGYSTIWLAAGARILGGRVVSLEHDPAKCEAWRRNIEEAGLTEWADLVEGDAKENLAAIEDVFDVVFIDAEKETTAVFRASGLEDQPGGLVVADNVLSHGDARGLLAGTPGGPDARQRDRPARPRCGDHRRPE